MDFLVSSYERIACSYLCKYSGYHYLNSDDDTSCDKKSNLVFCIDVVKFYRKAKFCRFIVYFYHGYQTVANCYLFRIYHEQNYHGLMQLV